MRRFLHLIQAVALGVSVTAAAQSTLNRAVIGRYDKSGCIGKGEPITVYGTGFGNARGSNRLVLWAGGVGVEMQPTLWSGAEIRATVPTDERVVEGREYQIRLEDALQHEVSNMGPPLKICEGQPPLDAKQLVDAVLRASGGGAWPKVRAIDFTFNAAAGTNMLISARHRWDVRGGTDTVSWAGKTVTVNVWNPAADEAAKAAYARWVNDSYWLIAPLKLKDPGVSVTYGGQQDGFDSLHLSFAKVGLTPGDQYNLYIDPQTHLVRRWDYMPSREKKTSGTWSNYKDYGGLILSTERTFGDKRIWFSDVRVESDR